MKTELITLCGIPACVYGAPAPRAYLFVHGKCGSKADAAPLAAVACTRGWQVIGIDLPGHGARTETMNDFTPWQAVPEIAAVAAGLQTRYPRLALCANSIGAWFSMLALAQTPLDSALFVSPMLDMERLIGRMMTWANVSEDALREAGEIPTDFGETLSWEYLSYVRAHPVRWQHTPTEILYAGRDELLERSTVDAFCAETHSGLTVMEDGEHWFHTPEQLAVLERFFTRTVPYAD